MEKHTEPTSTQSSKRSAASKRQTYLYLDCREGGEYSAANARLMLRLGLLSEAERLTLKNVL